MSYLLFLIILIGMALLLLFHTFWVRTTIAECRTPLLPKLTLIHITDLHGRTRFLNGPLHRLINKWQPDLVCVTGDLAQHRGQLDRVMGEIGRIEAREGIFFVPGNYEREEKRVIGKKLYTDQEYEEMKQVWEGAMRVLENQGIALPFENRILYLYGFDNSVYGNEAYVPQDREAGPAYTVFLAHSPKIISYIEERGLRADLLLTGHTHGGQIRLFGKTWGAYKHFHVGVKPDNRVGLFAISRGLGTTKLPVRLGCFPEITVYRFNSDRISL